MSTLLLRLAGPLQSWGVDSKLSTRNTLGEPSKSGVVGLVASAMGRSREDSVEDIAALRFGVRTDQVGMIQRDFHTAHHPDNKNLTYVTDRYYLADAVFLAGFEGDEELLREIDSAVRSPYYPLFLGRRSCPVTGRVSLGIREYPLEEALCQEPWQTSKWYARRQPSTVSLEIAMDSSGPVEGQGVRDVPVSYSQDRRSYAFRDVTRTSVEIENPLGRRTSEKPTEHDAFSALRGRTCTCRESS